PIADGAPAVVAERPRLAVPGRQGRAVEVGAIGPEAGLGIGGLAEKIAAGIGGAGPEGTVLARAPACPQLVKARQVIGRIAARHIGLGHEADHGMGLVDHRPDGDRLRRTFGPVRRPWLAGGARLGFGGVAVSTGWWRIPRRMRSASAW